VEVRHIGVEASTELGRALLDAGAPGLHIYALNRSESAMQIVENLGLAPTPDDA
jgi:methylenetetrahydrofolate reductase (NADPH)